MIIEIPYQKKKRIEKISPIFLVQLQTTIDTCSFCAVKNGETLSKKKLDRKKMRIFICILRIDYVNVVQVLWTIRWANLCTTKDAHWFLFNSLASTFLHKFLFLFLFSKCFQGSYWHSSYCRLSCVVLWDASFFDHINAHCIVRAEEMQGTNTYNERRGKNKPNAGHINYHLLMMVLHLWRILYDSHRTQSIYLLF